MPKFKSVTKTKAKITKQTNQRVCPLKRRDVNCKIKNKPKLEKTTQGIKNRNRSKTKS